MQKLLYMLMALAVTFMVWAQTRFFTVSKDGTGNCTTVQQTFDAVPPDNREKVVIYIKKGIYKEKLHLDSTKNLLR